MCVREITKSRRKRRKEKGEEEEERDEREGELKKHKHLEEKHLISDNWFKNTGTRVSYDTL